MTNVPLTRRTWLQGLALLTLYAGVSGRARGLAPRFGSLAVDAIVIDAGLPEAAVLAGSAVGEIRLEMLHDDVAELIYGRLAPRWRRYGVRGLAGVTRAAGLFLLESLAADYGLRTVGVRRAPRSDGVTLEGVCPPCEATPRPVGMGTYRAALLDGDEGAFAWWMMPVTRPRRAGAPVTPP